MEPKKTLSSAVVFTSVFFGSIIGAGITLIAAPKAILDLKGKISGTFEVIKEDIDDYMDHATLRLLEQSTVVIAKTKAKLNSLNLLKKSITDKISNSKKS